MQCNQYECYVSAMMLFYPNYSVVQLYKNYFLCIDIIELTSIDKKSKLIITLYYKFKINIYIVDDLLNPNLFYHLILKYDALNKETFHFTINTYLHFYFCFNSFK